MSKPLLSILFSSQDFVAVDKPPGYSVHNNEDPLNLMKILQAQLNYKELYPVHRLDKETSGVQVFALNAEAARQLHEQFQTRSVVKLYAGILRGKLKSLEGAWNQPLTDKAEGRKNPAGLLRNRVACETSFKVIQQNEYFSFCEFDLGTGRQHQIRKHTALANHSIVGDARYGDPKYNQRMARLYQTDRMFLHCQRLIISNQILEAPLPAEFNKLFSQA